MDESAQLKLVVEAALLAAGRPMSLDALQSLFNEELLPERQRLRQALEQLQDDYAERGIEVREVASGWRIQVRREFAPWISRLWDEKPGRYSGATMETLALIAYRQPITRGEIEAVRGVSVNTNTIKTLLEREWIRVVGHRDVPGKPALYATTREFLDYFGLKGLDDLPSLAEIRDLDEINRELNLPEPGQMESAPHEGDGEESRPGARSETDPERASSASDEVADGSSAGAVVSHEGAAQEVTETQAQGVVSEPEAAPPAAPGVAEAATPQTVHEGTPDDEAVAGRPPTVDS